MAGWEETSNRAAAVNDPDRAISRTTRRPAIVSSLIRPSLAIRKAYGCDTKVSSRAWIFGSAPGVGLGEDHGDPRSGKEPDHGEDLVRHRRFPRYGPRAGRAVAGRR